MKIKKGDGLMNVTAKVRAEIPKVLNAEGIKLSEGQLLNRLVSKVPELKRDDGKVRSGVLRGILNKLDTIPVKDLKIEKIGGNVYYYADENKGWNYLVDEFVKEIDNNDILKLDFKKDVSDEEIEFVKKASKVIIELKNIQGVE